MLCAAMPRRKQIMNTILINCFFVDYSLKYSWARPINRLLSGAVMQAEEVIFQIS